MSAIGDSCCPSPNPVPVNVPGPAGKNAFTFTTAYFITRNYPSSVTISVQDTSWMSEGLPLFVSTQSPAPSGFLCTVLSVISSTVVLATPLVNAGNEAPVGTDVPSGSIVTPAGLPGPAGTPGTVIPNPLTIALGGTNAQTVAGALQNLGLGYTPIIIAGVGTAYTMTNATQLIAFGTTSPSITLTQPGTYAIFSMAQLSLVGATYANGHSASVKLRCTSGSIGDLALVSNGFWATTTATGAAFALSPCAIYSTTNSTDIIQLWGQVDATPSAGSVTVTDASIFAIKLF